MPGPAQYVVEAAPSTTLVVTLENGNRYEVKMAMVVQAVFDTGQTNPLDGMPLLQIVSQVVTQTQQRQDGH
jgi:hypothetical protein